MESLSKHEPQELSNDGNDVQVLLPSNDDAEESKAPSEQWTGSSSPTMADKQPQSMIMREPPPISDQSQDRIQLLRRYPEFRALQSQNAHLRLENEELRKHILDLERRVHAELKWLIYFREPASKAQVQAIVCEGLAALFAKEPMFRSYECATFWVAQERPDWKAFRIDYVGCRLVAFRAAMKVAHADAQMPAGTVRTTQPPSVSLYKQPPQVPPVFTGTLEELANALQDAME